MTDAQGTTKLETNSRQAITSTQETEAFGRTIGSSGSTGSPFGFHGAEGYRQDGDGPAGLEPYQKVGARYYDATFGRFLTRDTDLSQSPYAYCDGDPVNNSDPSGHINIASPGVSTINGPAGTGTGLAVSSSGSTSGSNSSSSSGSGTSGITGGVTTSGLNSTVTLTSGGTTLKATTNDGQLMSGSAGGSVSLGGILSGLSFTFSDMVNRMPALNSQTAGLSYTNGIVTLSGGMSSSGATSVMLTLKSR